MLIRKYTEIWYELQSEKAAGDGGCIDCDTARRKKVCLFVLPPVSVRQFGGTGGLGAAADGWRVPAT